MIIEKAVSLDAVFSRERHSLKWKPNDCYAFMYSLFTEVSDEEKEQTGH